MPEPTMAGPWATPNAGWPSGDRDNGRRPLLSVVTAAYNEAENIPVFYKRLCVALDGQPVDWELVIVDDHSSDSTFAIAAQLAEADPRVRGIRLSRNVGSHNVMFCGLDQTDGDCTAILAADLQHPPELLPKLLAEWRAGAQVVWAARESREQEAGVGLLFSKLYYKIMRDVVGMKEMPANGADFFLVDRQVVLALRRINERNASILALLTWLGFRQTTVFHQREARLYGRSGWSFERKLKLVIDSVTSFTYLPIRLMSYAGFVTAALGFTYAAMVVVNAILGKPVEGWSSLIVVVLLLGGIQMVMLGTLGEYIWRSLDEARNRPRYFIESVVRQPAARESNAERNAQPSGERA